MEEDEFTHPGLRIFRDSDGFQILLPVKAERYRRLLHLVWMLVGLGVEVVLIAALLGWEPVPFPPRPFLAVLVALFSMAWAFLLYRWLWYAVGRERFIVTRDMVRVRREILGLALSRVFEREKIRDIRAGRFGYWIVYPSWGRMFIGHGEGEILIDTPGRTYAYGRGLEEDEAVKLAFLMKDEAHLRVPDRRRPSEIRAG
jgi:hypothetical protein